MATTAIFESCKSRKRKPNLSGFRSFAASGSLIDLQGTFRDNIRLFLREYGRIEDQLVCGMPTWSTLLVSETSGVVYPLYVIEETVEYSINPFCDHCKCIGWGNHFVSKRKYHLIIPATRNKQLKGNSLKRDDHLLRGLIHCNGFGHLICINAQKEESDYISGSVLMDLWDRLCVTLGTRKISVKDFSRKKSMELRLLHCVAYGHSWFGKWGYKFCRGTFGVSNDKYNRAIQFLSTIELDMIMDDFNNTDRGRKLERIISNYREACGSNLTTVSDLLQLMFNFKSGTLSRNEKDVTVANYDSMKTLSRKTDQNQSVNLVNAVDVAAFARSLARNDCRWPARRLKEVVAVIVELLEEKKANASGDSEMSRHELRQGARNRIGDTGLIDFVLKSISSVAVGSKVVSRSINPLTKLVEFKIHDFGEAKLSNQLNKFASTLAKFDCRWPEQRLEHAAQVVVNILKESKATRDGTGAMSRQELRDAARQCIGDTGLIDFVLKSINNAVIGDQIVFRCKNPSSRLIEFSVYNEDTVELPSMALDQAIDPYEDIIFIYENVLLGYPEWDLVSSETEVILNSKYFMKEWVFKDEHEEELMTITCQVLPSFDELETELIRPLPPGDLVVVPPNITIRELKVVAQLALRDTYCLMDQFVVTQIGGLKGIEDERLISSVVDSGRHVWVRGCGLDLRTKLRYEGEADNGKVDCICGAQYDDGERMIACDACNVWSHTMCNDIDDDESAPSFFYCENCSVRMDSTMKTTTI